MCTSWATVFRGPAALQKATPVAAIGPIAATGAFYDINRNPCSGRNYQWTISSWWSANKYFNQVSPGRALVFDRQCSPACYPIRKIASFVLHLCARKLRAQPEYELIPDRASHVPSPRRIGCEEREPKTVLKTQLESRPWSAQRCSHVCIAFFYEINSGETWPGTLLRGEIRCTCPRFWVANAHSRHVPPQITWGDLIYTLRFE